MIQDAAKSMNNSPRSSPDDVARMPSVGVDLLVSNRRLHATVKVRSPCPRLYIAAAVMLNTTVCGVIRTWDLSHSSRAR